MMEKKANHGEKMIEFKIRFWTNDIAELKDHICPKHAWSSGVISITKNDSHGIESSNPKPFHTLLDIATAIENELIEHEIKLHPSRKLKKYLMIESS